MTNLALGSVPCRKISHCSFLHLPFPYRNHGGLVLTHEYEAPSRSTFTGNPRDATKIKSLSCSRNRNFTKEYSDSNSTHPSCGRKLAIQDCCVILKLALHNSKAGKASTTMYRQMLRIHPEEVEAMVP